MNKTMEKQILLIQIAQLKDELSDVNKELSSVKMERDNAVISAGAEIRKIREEHVSEMSSLKESHRLDIERRDSLARFEMAETKKNHRKELLEKELELQRMKESYGIFSETSRKTLDDVTSKCNKLEASLSQNVSRNVWYSQRYWGKNSEQARLLQNRNPLTRREEKELFQMNAIPDDRQIDTSELNTVRRKKNTCKKLRLDYSKNKPYTSNPHYIKLDDYSTLTASERYKMRNGVIEKRIKRMVRMVPAHFEEFFIEVATIRSNGEEYDSYVIDDQVIPGVPFDAEMISFILTEHYSFNTTWANIAKKLEYYDVRINDSTLGDIAHRCITYLKESMGDVWKEELFTTDYWMIDETTGLVGITDKNTDKRYYQTKYMWGIRANKLRLSWFIYDNGSRGRKVIKPYLDKFKGFFTTDGYVVYKLYEKISDANQIRCACLTHIRRLFVDALHENRSIMSWFINKIKKLFEIESECKEHGLSGLERANVRILRSSIIMHDIEKKFQFYIDNGSFHKLGKMTQAALKYISNEWSAMKNVLKFGDAELSNNLCEQMMRHVKTNLKNSQNIGSEKSAGNFCFMYSLVESCGFNSLSPIKYISHLLHSLVGLEDKADRRMLLPCYCNL